MLRAQRARLGFLVGTGRERGHRATPRVQEPDRQVAEPADADHADTLGRAHAALDDRVENGDTAAEQRAGLRWIYARGQRNRPCALAAHGIGEPAETAQDGPFHPRA